jgi:putative transposase
MPETALFAADPEENVKDFLQPWQLLMLVLAGWVNHQQQDVVEYLLVENRVFRQKLGKGRILLNDEQRRRLAIKGKIPGRKMLEQVAGSVTPETILRWHRELLARHWDYSDRRKKIGRPAIPKEIADLVLKLAKENSRWGYNRIQGARRNLGYSISDTAIAKILKTRGIYPAPGRKRQGNWKEFLSTHRDVLASVDFSTIGVWTKKGLVTYYLLSFMELATRQVHLAGLTAHPNEDWLLQVARNMTDAEVISPRQAIPADGSRREILGGISWNTPGRRRKTSPPADAIAEFEREHRVVHAKPEGGVFGSDDIPWRKIPARGRSRYRSSLSY